MWSKFNAAWQVDFAELEQVYSRTARCAGLLHAVRGPRLDTEEDIYTVSLSPVGLQCVDAKPCNEQQAASAAHGLLHGLAALHKVRYSLLEIDEPPGVLQCGNQNPLSHLKSMHHTGGLLADRCCKHAASALGARQRPSTTPAGRLHPQRLALAQHFLQRGASLLSPGLGAVC